MSYYKCYKRISSSKFIDAEKADNFIINEVISHEDIVEYFGKEIRQYLLEDKESARLLFDQYLTSRENRRFFYYFPKQLTDEDKNLIIHNYITWDKANPNYIELICKSNASSELKIFPKEKLAAKKKYDELIEAFFSQNKGIPFGVQVAFINNVKEVVRTSIVPENCISIEYDANWVAENLDYPTVLNSVC
jgi:hypothetical protein